MDPTKNDRALYYGCLQCRPGTEEQVKAEISQNLTSVKAIVPRQKTLVCKDGVHSVDSVILFPGTLYFRAGKDLDVKKLLKLKGGRGILTNADGSWALRAEDRELASFLFSIDRDQNIF